MHVNTYISILRGINVGGRNVIKTDALRKSYEMLNFSDISIYIQSGNIVFNSEESEKETLQKNISLKIKEDFGLDIPVMVLTIDRLKQIIRNNPFLNENADEAFLHVTFFADTPADYNRKAIESKKQANEEIAFSDEAIYLYCPNGYGKTKLNNNFLETQLKVTATTRNWKTVNELLKIAENIRR